MSSDIAVQDERIMESAVRYAEIEAVKADDAGGITDYPVLDFDEDALSELTEKVKSSLKTSNIKPNGGFGYRFLKRTIDITGSFLGLVLLSVPMGVISLMIYREDKGSPFFIQERLTKDGKVFKMYKFRSMCVDAEEKFREVQKTNQTDGLAFKMENDPRVTKIGRFIRKTSIDELPQLINVLKGDMSIIGPRPPLPREVNLYTPHQMQRLLVKGGLSCYCQCNGRSDMPFDEWVESDLEYIENRSTKLDIKLMLKTLKVVICGKGAR
ncbi:MAG: sugar transferase [Oscillospiraceae bacterium]|nr:sugar transferase [Oscillospiraceae bacterium]